MFPGALTRIAVVAAVCAATAVNGTRPGGAAGTEKRPVPDPTVSGPIPGQPASLSAVAAFASAIGLRAPDHLSARAGGDTGWVAGAGIRPPCPRP